MLTKIGVEFEIDFAHTLKGHPKCGKPHGHTSRIIVEASGESKKGSTYEDNMIIEFDEMKKFAGRQSNNWITQTLTICLIFPHQKI